MTNFKPTDEQLAVRDHITAQSNNLCVTARAGAAKTTTLELSAAANVEPTLALAFNKKIAEEMAERLPEHCTSSTLNSIGHRAWMSNLGRRLQLNDKKLYHTLRYIINEEFHGEDQNELNEQFSDLARAIELARVAGYMPNGNWRTARPMYTPENFDEVNRYELNSLELDCMDRVLTHMINEALAGKIDFTDQIYMPALFPCSFNHYPLIMVDEAQDLSGLNHRMLTKLTKRSRLVAVGDPFQAIYGFRGADSNSMTKMAAQWEMDSLTLSTSFRCPREVTKLAQRLAPDMTWPDWAITGSVTTHDKWDQSLIPENAAIICRNNAPLLRLALALIRAKRPVTIAGRDIIRQLITRLKAFGSPAIRQKQLLLEIEQWRVNRKRRDRDTNTVDDLADALKFFAEETTNLGEAIELANQLANSEGRIKLMTGHRAKGLEFEKVFFLDQHLCKWDRGQDANIWYVIVTRSKDELHFIDSGNMTL